MLGSLVHVQSPSYRPVAAVLIHPQPVLVRMWSECVMTGAVYFVDLLDCSGAVDNLLKFMFVDEMVSYNDGEERGRFASARWHLQNTMTL